MRVFNDMDTIYARGITEQAGVYTCTVCQKEYKTYAGITRHFGEQNCHSYRNIFEGTATEELLYDIFKELMAIEGKHVVSVKKFRHTRSYTIIAKFFIFCYQNGVRDHFDYLEYVLGNTKWKVVMQGVSKGCLESVLKDYRKYRRQTPDRSRDTRFYNEHEAELREDPTFALRALERGEITVGFLFGQMDLDEFLDKCTDAEEYRFEKFLEMVS